MPDAYEATWRRGGLTSTWSDRAKQPVHLGDKNQVSAVNPAHEGPSARHGGGRRWDEPGPLRETPPDPGRVLRAPVGGLLAACGWFLLGPVLVSLRWHGGADLITAMVAGGSHSLHTSATASHIRVLRRLGYSSCLTTGLPRAPVRFSLPRLDNIFPGISFKPKPYEMQVHWETPEPVRFRQQNFFSEDNTAKRRLDGGRCRRCSSAGRFVCVRPSRAC